MAILLILVFVGHARAGCRRRATCRSSEDPVGWASHMVHAGGHDRAGVRRDPHPVHPLRGAGGARRRTTSAPPRAKGLRDGLVLRRHVLRNALIPVVTVTGVQLASLLGGVIVVEVIFAWPGLGRLTLRRRPGPRLPGAAGRGAAGRGAVPARQPRSSTCSTPPRPEDPVPGEQRRPGPLSSPTGLPRRRCPTPVPSRLGGVAPQPAGPRSGWSCSALLVVVAARSATRWRRTAPTRSTSTDRLQGAAAAATRSAPTSSAATCSAGSSSRPACRCWSASSASGIALLVGVTLGLVAGFYGGWVDDVLMRCMDVLFAFPAILLAIAILAVLGPGLVNAMIAIGVVYTPIFARVTRASVLVGARGGLRPGRALARRRATCGCCACTCCRTSLAPIIVQTSLSLAFAILSEAALSFLGLGDPAARPLVGADAARGPRLRRAGLVDRRSSPASRSS